MTQLEMDLIETVTSQRGCLLDNHFAMSRTLEFLQMQRKTAERERMIKILKHSVRAAKKELCESRKLSELDDNEKGRLGI